MALDTSYSARLARYLAAEERILLGQSYKMPDGRELVRANLDEVQKTIKELTKLAAREEAGGGMSIRLATPRRGC